VDLAGLPTLPPASAMKENTSSRPATKMVAVQMSEHTRNEPLLYCTCRRVSFGQMVACDNADCAIEWYHYGCVGLKNDTEPPDPWFCPSCRTTFRRNQLVRLHSLRNTQLNGKLVRIKSHINEETGRFDIDYLVDPAPPPLLVRQMSMKPEHCRHVCEYCHKMAVAGSKLLNCARCMTAQYCSKQCQRADWARHKLLDCVRFSDDRGVDTAMQEACFNGDREEVRRLVEKGADVCKAMSNGSTALCSAVAGGSLPMVVYLVEVGADVNQPRATSHTPLHVAASKGFVQVVEYLLEQAADKDQTTNDGETPLISATMNGHFEVVVHLVRFGADVDKAPGRSATPLYHAASRDFFKIV